MRRYQITYFGIYIDFALCFFPGVVSFKLRHGHRRFMRAATARGPMSFRIRVHEKG